MYISTTLLGLFSAVSFVTESANITNGDNIFMVLFIYDDCRYDSLNDK